MHMCMHMCICMSCSCSCSHVHTFSIRVVQAFAFVLMYQHPRHEPLLRAMPTELCRTLCSLAIPFLAWYVAGQTCTILARAMTIQRPDVCPAAP
jgi:hypothetical protein